MHTGSGRNGIFKLLQAHYITCAIFIHEWSKHSCNRRHYWHKLRELKNCFACLYNLPMNFLPSKRLMLYILCLFLANLNHCYWIYCMSIKIVHIFCLSDWNALDTLIQTCNATVHKAGRFVAGKLCHLPFCRLPFRHQRFSRYDTSSLGHFITGAWRRQRNSPEYKDDATWRMKSVQIVPILDIYMAC